MDGYSEKEHRDLYNPLSDLIKHGLPFLSQYEFFGNKFLCEPFFTPTSPPPSRGRKRWLALRSDSPPSAGGARGGGRK
jgi:hypothetical protein